MNALDHVSRRIIRYTQERNRRPSVNSVKSFRVMEGNLRNVQKGVRVLVHCLSLEDAGRNRVADPPDCNVHSAQVGRGRALSESP